jgi:hypothetical protein
MGLFAEWMMVKGLSVPSEAVEARFSWEGLSVSREEDGWVLARARGHDLDALAHRLNKLSVEPWVAGWIYDSDFAYLTGAGPGSARFALVVGSPYSDSAGEEPHALSQLASGEGKREAAEACAAWSRSNANPVSTADILAVLERDWTFAEEGVAALAGLMGLPDPLVLWEPQEPNEQTGVSVSLSIDMLATLSAWRLFRRLDGFSGERGMTHTEKTIEIHLDEAAASGPAFEELIGEVQRFVDEVGLPQLTVFAAGRAHTVQREAPNNLDG